MDLDGNLKVIKREKSEDLEGIYLENPDDKSKIICVYIGGHCGKEYFAWNTKMNLEFVKCEEAAKHDDKYYYKGCEIRTDFERDTWGLTVIITGNWDLDIKSREIDAGSVGYEKEEALTEALNLIDEAILKNESKKDRYKIVDDSIKNKLEETKEKKLLHTYGKMGLSGRLKIVKNLLKEQVIYLENPDDKFKIIRVRIVCDDFCGIEYFQWNNLINLEVVKYEDVKEIDKTYYYYKGCTIYFENDNNDLTLTVIIEGNYDLDIKNRCINVGTLNDSYEDIKMSLVVALDSIDEAILKNESEKEKEEQLYEKGNKYYFGKGVEKDYKKAFEIFKDLADNKEHLGAMEALCYMYYYGKGTDVNYELARKYCEKVEQKNSKCNRNIFQFLGEMYFEGLGVESDYIKAKAYFEKSLNDNYDDTYYKLGLLNSGNYRIEKDEVTANMYFNKIEEDLLLSIIYLLLAIRPEEEQNLEGIYKCLEYSREEYSHILKTNIPFDHLAAIYYKKVDYLQNNEYDNIVKRLKEKIEWCLQEEVKIEKGTFTFENKNDVNVYANTIVTINK